MGLKHGEATSGLSFLFSLFLPLLCAVFINCNANFSIGLDLPFLDLKISKNPMKSSKKLNQIIKNKMMNLFNQTNLFVKIENISSRKKDFKN